MTGIPRVSAWIVAALFFMTAPLAFADYRISSLSQRSLRQANPPAATQPASEPLRTATDRKFNIRHIRLDLRVDLEKKSVLSQATIDFQSMRPTKTLSLDAVGFEVKKVMLAQEGKASSQAQFKHDGKKLEIELGNQFPKGQKGTVTVEYDVKSPRTGLHFFAPSKTSPDTPLQVWSQGQTITNRYWIPCVDEPNQRQTTQVVVTVPIGFEAISNGKLQSRKENPADKTVTFDWFQSIPHPSYLITLVVGQFDVVQEDWNGIPVMYYVPKGRKDEALPTYGKTPAMLSFFSSRFGINYPWDKYAQISAHQFGGGMENTSATTMGDGILKDQRSLLDGNSEWIVAHELAHQWWGDMVTCRDWSHTWLNEGFASYSEALWDEHSKGKDDYDWNMYQKSRGALASGKTRPIMDRRYTNPDAMFDGRSYPKAAWVLHMLRNRLGDDAFFTSVKNYGTQYKFQSVETGDFRRSIERTTDRGLERFFYDWLERPANPDLEVNTTYQPDKRLVQVTVKQTQANELYHLPLKVLCYCKGIQEPTIIEDETRDKEAKLSANLPGVLERIEFDPDQAILAIVTENKSRDLWQAQLLHGSTTPLRAQAALHFSKSKEPADRELLAKAFQSEKFYGVKTLLAQYLGNAEFPEGKAALLLGLQDKDARVRSACVTQLGRYKADDEIITAFRTIVQKGDPSYAVESAALRIFPKLKQKDSLVLLTPWLAKPSHRNSLATTALLAINELQDPAALDTMIEYSAANHPRNTRNIAQRAVLQFVKSKKLNADQQKNVMKFYLTTLQNADELLLATVYDGLPLLGSLAEPALPHLDKLADSLPAGTLKSDARKTADKIREALKKTDSKEASKKATESI